MPATTRVTANRASRYRSRNANPPPNPHKAETGEAEQPATPAFSKPVAPERPAGRASNDPRLRRRQQQAEQAARENSGDGNPGA